jgi:nucleoside phosphorylase
VLVGTCGAYEGSGLRIGDVVAAKTVCLADGGVAEGRAAFPEIMRQRLDLSPDMRASLTAAGAREARVATTLGVTTDDACAHRLAECGEAEHLEAFAVASACAAAGVPLAIVLGVANTVGASGRAEWRANHARAGLAATEQVEQWIAAGAPGL